MSEWQNRVGTIRVAAMGVEVPSGYFRGLEFLKKIR
jgi:hypothetical protein